MSDHRDYPGTPAWVKATGKIAAFIAVLLIAAMIFGGGKHGPWRHLSFEATPTATTGADGAPAIASPTPTVPAPGGS